MKHAADEDIGKHEMIVAATGRIICAAFRREIGRQQDITLEAAGGGEEHLFVHQQKSRCGRIEYGH
jgi:hypothetical protein